MFDDRTGALDDGAHVDHGVFPAQVDAHLVRGESDGAASNFNFDGYFLQRHALDVHEQVVIEEPANVVI